MTARIPASRRRRVISLLYLCLLLVLGLGAGGAAAGSPRPRRLPADNTAPVAPPLPRQAGNDSAPACLVDAVALSVAGFSFAARTATAELRVLAVCSSQMGVTDVLRLVGPQGDGSVQVSAQGGAPLPAEAQAQLPGMVWMAAAQYRADVRARFELKYYPFDRIRVPVALEATKPWGDMEVRFGLLDANPGSRIGNGFFTDEALMLQGLPIVVAGNFGYVPDSFGAQAPEFARFTFEYEFRRDDVTTFVQVMLASYLAFMLSVSSLALPVEEHFDSRMGILGARWAAAAPGRFGETHASTASSSSSSPCRPSRPSSATPPP
ncbi:hypothetical protein DFJ74DRAFT_248611 [Hyaloraphidium curvatum]|nr:hypothetical protein DFJ74DRAFT_248611 [Hyaloraphidium curvatum]